MSVTIDGLLGVSKVAEDADVVHEGDFGVGAGDTPLITEAGALDTIAQSGFYRVGSGNAAYADAPSGSGSGVILHVNYAVSGYASQVYSSITGETRQWTRSQVLGVWTDWIRVFNQGTILGSVGQSGGVPTGAIIERGENANGEYVKFADGTMICQFTSDETLVFSTAVGSVYAVETASWTFPVTFAYLRNVIFTPRAGSVWGGTSVTVSVAAATGRLFGASNLGSVPVKVMRTAMGRWC